MKSLHGIVVDMLITNDQNQVLLAKRSTSEDCPSTWSIPGGNLSPGEDEEVGLRREIKEELGVDIKTLLPFGAYRVDHSPGFYVYAVYFTGTIEGQPKVDGKELEECRWFDIDEKILDLDFAFNQKEVMKNFIDWYLGSRK